MTAGAAAAPRQRCRGAVGAPPARDRVFLPAGTPHEAGRQLRGWGWITVAGLEPVADVSAEARRMGCTHVWVDGDTVALKDA